MCSSAPDKLANILVFPEPESNCSFGRKDVPLVTFFFGYDTRSFLHPTITIHSSLKFQTFISFHNGQGLVFARPMQKHTTIAELASGSVQLGGIPATGYFNEGRKANIQTAIILSGRYPAFDEGGRFMYLIHSHAIEVNLLHQPAECESPSPKSVSDHETRCKPDEAHYES